MGYNEIIFSTTVTIVSESALKKKPTIATTVIHVPLSNLKSDIQKTHDSGVSDTLNYLRKTARERNYEKLLANERLMLVHALKFDANAPEEIKSLEAAIAQLDESLDCFTAMREDPRAYKKMLATYSSKRKEAGLPLDAAREFFRSHTTRLTNSLAAKGSKTDKQIIRQRKENLKVIQECYIELQQKTLGIYLTS